MSLLLASLASGSSGNAVLLRAGRTTLLIDTGLSFKALKEGLAALDMAPEELDAVLVTHEHADHTAGLPVLIRKVSLPVYLTAGTYDAIARTALFARLPKSVFHLIRPGEAFTLGEVEVLPLPTSHDAAEPVAYRFAARGRRVALVTDLGVSTPENEEALRGLDGIYLEANHDRRMLETGPYPYALKLRIAGERGHLSNEQAGRLLTRLYHPGLRQVVLAHLSKENNYPPLAVETVRSELEAAGIRGEHLPRISAAPEKGLSQTIELL